jgi:hypothetical protein
MRRDDDAHGALVEVACVAVLLVAFARLLVFDLAQWREYQKVERRTSREAVSGSLAGVDAEGRVQQPPPSGYTLIFALHAQRLKADVAFWNAVVGRIDQSTEYPMHYVAVCDSGLACRDAESTARFPVVSFMDPLEMQAVAKADGENEVLLYRRELLKGRPRTSTEPLGTARAVVKALE